MIDCSNGQKLFIKKQFLENCDILQRREYDNFPLHLYIFFTYSMCAFVAKCALIYFWKQSKQSNIS